MQLFLYLLGSSLLIGTGLLIYGATHAPVGTETPEGFAVTPDPADAAASGTPRSAAAKRHPTIPPSWPPAVRT
jgi:hypothetical protein